MRTVLGVPRDQQPLTFYADSWDKYKHVPNRVPTEFGANINWRRVSTAHRLKASIGIGGSSIIAGGLRKDVTNAMVNLANTMIPKYIASFLFLEVIAYIL